VRKFNIYCPICATVIDGKEQAATRVNVNFYCPTCGTWTRVEIKDLIKKYQRIKPIINGWEEAK
jgi:ribosomal protein L44E